MHLESLIGDTFYRDIWECVAGFLIILLNYKSYQIATIRWTDVIVIQWVGNSMTVIK